MPLQHLTQTGDESPPSISSSHLKLKRHKMIKSLFKFKTYFFVLACYLVSNICTQESCSELTQETTPCCFSQPLFEVKTGYFFFSDSKMSKIYDQRRIGYSIMCFLSFMESDEGWTLNAYGAVEYFHRSGKSINGHQKTSLWSVPVNIGLKACLRN